MSSRLIVNSIRHTGASGDAVTLANDGTCTANITNNLSNRNLIINGSQIIDQRGVSTEVTPVHDQYLTDRWNAHLSQTSKYKVQQVTDGPVGFSNSLKITSLSAYTPIATDYFLINQYIEGYNMAHLGWGAAGAKTVTISFWVKSSVTGNYAVALRQPWNRAQNQSYTISSANTWEKKSLTFTGDTGGTWNTTNGQGMSVGFILGGGSNYEATSGSWAAGSAFRFSGATNLVATNAATFYVTGVQLEVGSNSTDYEFKSYSQELALCQRYYQQLTLPGDYSNSLSSAYIYRSYSLPVQQRATGTGSVVSQCRYYSGGSGVNFTPTVYPRISHVFVTGSSLSNGNGFVDGTIALDAEL